MNKNGNKTKQKCWKKRSIQSVKKRGECWSAKHSTICSEVAIAFTIIFEVWGRKLVPWENAIYNSIIQDMYKSRTYVVEFLRRQRRGWSSSEYRATTMYLVYIREADKEEGVE